MSNSVRSHRRQPTRLPRPWDSPGKNTGVGCHFLLQCIKVKVKSLSRVRLLVTPWTAAHQGPPTMGFFRQEYWSGVPLSLLSYKSFCSRPVSRPLRYLWNLYFRNTVDIAKLGSRFIVSHFPGGTSGKGSANQYKRHRRRGFDPWVRKIPLEKGMATHSSILAWKIPWT